MSSTTALDCGAVNDCKVLLGWSIEKDVRDK